MLDVYLHLIYLAVRSLFANEFAAGSEEGRGRIRKKLSIDSVKYTVRMRGKSSVNSPLFWEKAIVGGLLETRRWRLG